jgi:hypothetical protein
LLKKAELLLFLNKLDLLEDKVARLPPQKFIMPYTGSSAPSFIIFVSKLFKSVVPSGRPVHVRKTSCIDKESMQVVLNSVLKNVLSQNLASLGLIEE